MDNNMIAVIREAIRSRHQLVFTTTSDFGEQYHRVTCPHILGTKQENWHVFVWQINDESEHGFEEGAQRWRCIDLDDMSNVVSQEGEWYQGWSTGQRNQRCIDVIDTVVDAAYAAEVRSTSRAHTR